MLRGEWECATGLLIKTLLPHGFPSEPNRPFRVWLRVIVSLPPITTIVMTWHSHTLPLPHLVTLIRFASPRQCTGRPESISSCYDAHSYARSTSAPHHFNCRCVGVYIQAAQNLKCQSAIFYGIMFLGTTVLLPTPNKQIPLISFYFISASLTV